MSHYFKYKLNPTQHGFSEAKYTTTNVVTYLHFFCRLVASQHHVYSVSVDLSSAFALVSLSILLHRLCASGLSDSYVSQFRSYLSSR